MPSDAPVTPGAPRALPISALTAFLHGIEARAWVFALCQGGEPQRADQALAGAEREFVARAGSLPLARWPLQFWAALLRQPGLLAPLDPELDLSRLEPGPRAALLLRLLASLDVPHAAEALGVSVRAYEAALGQALAAPGHPDNWLPNLREQLHALAHELPAPTRAHLDAIRSEVLAEAASGARTAAHTPAPAQVVSAQPTPHAAPRWPWFGLGMLLLALLLSLVLPLPGRLKPGESERLPAEAVPPPPELSDTVVVTHPDFAQLAEPELEAITRDLAFLSWLSANRVSAAPAAVPEAGTGASAPQDFAALSGREQHMLSSAAGVWSTLAPKAREDLRANANDWHATSSPRRAALRARLQAWDAQPAAERARRRLPFHAWSELPAGERKRVAGAHAHAKALPAEQQAALRAQFAALDADTQRVWWLGPELGQQLAPIAVLFAFLPEADRPALLDALRGLDPVARAELSLLAPRLDAAGKQALRRQLLALPPEQRAAFVHERLAGSRLP